MVYLLPSPNSAFFPLLRCDLKFLVLLQRLIIATSFMTLKWLRNVGSCPRFFSFVFQPHRFRRSSLVRKMRISLLEQNHREHKTTSSCISMSRTTSRTKAPGTYSQVTPTGTPLLANSATNTLDGPGFVGYVVPKGFGAKLSAVSINNQTTNQTFLVLPSRSGTTILYLPMVWSSLYTEGSW